MGKNDLMDDHKVMDPMTWMRKKLKMRDKEKWRELKALQKRPVKKDEFEGYD